MGFATKTPKKVVSLEAEFIGTSAIPFTGAAINGGIFTQANSDADHVGACLIAGSAVPALGGYGILLTQVGSKNKLVLPGSRFTAIFKPNCAADTGMRLGFFDTHGGLVSPNCVCMDIVVGVVTGHCLVAGVGSATPTTYTLVNTKWYSAEVNISEDGTSVEFVIIDCLTGDILWRETLGNITYPATLISGGFEGFATVAMIGPAIATVDFVSLEYPNPIGRD